VEEREGEIGNEARLSEWQAWLGMDQATWMERKNGMNYIRAEHISNGLEVRGSDVYEVPVPTTYGSRHRGIAAHAL